MSAVTNDLGEEILPAYKGNLTDSQQKDLREMWRRMFELYEKNKDVSERIMKQGGPSKMGKKKDSAPPKNEKDAGKDIPKDDKAKEEAKKAEELKEMNEFIDTYGGPILAQTMWEFTKMDHPDVSLLRFLRARKWDIDRALAMLAAACKFRLEKDVPGIIYKGEDGLKDVPGFMNQFRRGISYIKGNTDKMENPIYFIHVARHFTSAQKHEVLQDYVLLAMENARQITTSPYEKAVVVFDMAGFGLKNMDWQCVLFLVKCLEAYYPESLQRIYVHGAPWIFKGIWQVLQPMLDPVVRDKIKFSSKAKDLEELVPASKIRKGMGGTMDWDWDYIEPQAGENDIMKDTKSRAKIEAEMKELTDEFENVTRDWMENTSNDDDDPDLALRRDILAKQIRLKHYQLQPFVRAKNIYQRSGIMTMDGTVTWEYPQTNGKSITQVVNDRHNYGALIKWLQDHNADTLEDSYGHKKLAEICTDGTIKKSYGGGKGGSGKAASSKAAKSSDAASTKSSGKKSSKKGEAAAAGGAAAGAGAAAAGALGLKKSKSKSKKKPEPEPEPEPESEEEEESDEDGFEDPESEPEPEPAPRAKRSNKNLARQPSKKSVEPEHEPEHDDEHDDEQPQTYTGAAVGAVAGVAAGVGGAAAAGLSYLRGGNKNGNAANGNGNGYSHHDEEDVDEEDEDDEDHGVARPGQRQRQPPRTVDRYPDEEEDFDEDASPDDDQMSAYSDESITPETAVRPDYMNVKISAADCRIDDNDCREDLATAREAMALFLNSRMREAEELCMDGASTRLYKAEGMALINSVKSVMTFEPADFETAIMCCQHSMKIAGFLRKKQGAIGKLISGKKGGFRNMTLVQLHAELVFAESQLLKSVLGIFYSGDSIGFVKQALGLRSAYFLVRELFKFVESVDAEAEEAEVSGKRHDVVHLDQDFRSGVYLGNALCSLVLSMLPKNTLKIMEGFGFVGDRKFSLDLLARAGGWSKSKPLPTISADEEGVRRPLCDITILMYHLWISSYIPVTELDFEFADKVLSWNLVRFPNGIFYLFWSARLYAAQALPEKAIEYYRNAIESQREFKQLHHLCFWDLSLTYLCTCDFARAYECYDVLSRESNWSKAIYQYAKAVMLYETGMDDRAKSATIMRTVGKLTKKVAGRQIPFERFVALKAKKYIAQQNRLPLPGLEFSYLWHCIGQTPVFLLVENTLTRIDEFIDELESYHNPKSYGTGENEYWSSYCLAFFLRGVALRFVAYPEPQTLVRLPADDSVGPIEEIQADAVQSFNKVFEHGQKLDEVDRYLVYFAHYELGRLRSCMGQDEAAKTEFRKVLSGKPLEAKGKGLIGGGSKANYLLSNMCQVRAHAAMETMRIQKSRSRASFFHGAEGSLASQSIASKSTRSNSLASSSASRSMTSRATSMSSRSGRGSIKSNTYDAEEAYGRPNGRARADTGRSQTTDYSRRR